MLSDSIRRTFALPSFDELVHVVKEMGRDQIAQLSKTVYEAARSGDVVAEDILRRAGLELGAIAEAVVKGSAPGVRIALIGGVFKAGDYVVEPLLGTLRQRGIDVEFIRPRFPSCVGGLILAYDRSGIGPTNSLLMNLERSLSSSALKALSGP